MWGPRAPSEDGVLAACGWEQGSLSLTASGVGTGKGPHRPLLGGLRLGCPDTSVKTFQLHSRPRMHVHPSAMLRASHQHPPPSGRSHETPAPQAGGRRVGWTPVRRRGRPATCLPAPASPPSLGAAASPRAESQLWGWSKGPGQRVLLGRGRSKHRKREKPDEARPPGRKRLFWEELLFLRRGREETLEKQRRADRRRTALTQEASLLEASNLEGANLQMLRNDSLLGRGRGPHPIDREVRLRNTHKPGARQSWTCPTQRPDTAALPAPRRGPQGRHRHWAHGSQL